jgi:hypothetical protein
MLGAIGRLISTVVCSLVIYIFTVKFIQTTIDMLVDIGILGGMLVCGGGYDCEC